MGVEIMNIREAGNALLELCYALGVMLIALLLMTTLFLFVWVIIWQ